MNVDFNLNDQYDKIVIVDPGKNAVKVLVFSTQYELLSRFVFPSKTMKKRNFADIDGSSDKQFKIEYDSQKYLVGEGVIQNYNFDATKNNLHHKLCIYTAIANVVTKKNEKIYLVVGYPSSDFRNSEQREEYLNLLKSEEAIEITINGEDKKFSIDDIAVLPEGIALKPRMVNAGRKVHVNDIGGQNINYRRYDAKGNTLISFSLDNAGINHLEEYVRKELRSFINADIISVEDVDILEAIKSGKIREVDDSLINNYKTSKEFIEDTVLNFIETHILGQLISKGVNLYQRGDLIIFSGGGSLVLKPYFEKILVNNENNMHFSETAQWDNCISYAVKDLGDRCKKIGELQKAQLIGQKILKQITMDEKSLIV